MTERDIYDFMAKRKLGVLGTIGRTNLPQSSLVGIAVTKELEIVFDTVKTSRKYGNLVARPDCSFAVGWEGEQTVQYEGEAAELSGNELVRLQGLYFETWPECRVHLTWPDIVYFAVRPRWIRFSDYDQKPPLIQEFYFNGRNELC
jgi:Pyridoxamine 5'-phosphate oxidase